MKKITIEVSVDETDESAYSIQDILTNNVGRPFDCEWPRGKDALNKRAEILMKAGIKSLRNWKEPPIPYRIMSFDGGGIRGIFSSRILFRIEEKVPGFSARADLYAGTSTGAIIAGLLAFGMTPAEVYAKFDACGKKVFSDTMIDDVRDMGKIIGADYTLDELKKLLVAIFDDVRLGDLKKKIVIPTFQLDGHLDGARTWKPKIQHNTGLNDEDNNIKLVDAILRSVAGPSFFPTYQGCIDGGVCANDPTMCAISQALCMKDSQICLDGIRAISIGTGTAGQFIEGEKDWGLAQWARPMLDILIDGNMGIAAYQAKSVLGNRYIRINKALEMAISLDDVSKCEELIDEANNTDLGCAFSFLQTEW